MKGNLWWCSHRRFCGNGGRGPAVGVNGGNNVKVALTDVAAAADVVTVAAPLKPRVT